MHGNHIARRLTLATVIAGLMLLGGTREVGAHTAAAGRVLATIAVGNGPNAVAVDTRLGRAYVLRNARYTAGAVNMLDSRTGAVLRTVEMDQGPQALVIDQATNHLFVSAFGSADSIDNGSISMLDARTDTLLRTIPMAHPVAMALDALLHRLFVLDSSTGGMRVLDTRTGAMLHTIHVGGLPFAIAVDERANHVFVVNFAAARVSMLDAATGRLLRTTSLGPTWPRSGDAATSIAVDGRAGRVYVSTLQSSSIYMLNSRSGALLRVFPVGPNPLAMAVDAAAGRLYVTIEGAVDQYDNPLQRGAVRVFTASTGAPLGSAVTGVYPAALAIDDASGRAIIFNMADASLSVLNTRTTTVLRTLPIKAVRVAGIDPLPQALAIDAATGRAFAVNLGGSHITILDAR